MAPTISTPGKAVRINTSSDPTASNKISQPKILNYIMNQKTGEDKADQTNKSDRILRSKVSAKTCKLPEKNPNHKSKKVRKAEKKKLRKSQQSDSKNTNTILNSTSESEPQSTHDHDENSSLPPMSPSSSPASSRNFSEILCDALEESQSIPSNQSSSYSVRLSLNV